MAGDSLSEATLRIFIAIPFHEAFQHEIDVVLRRLSDRLSHVKWIKSEQAHLTLHFFGDTPASEIGRLDQRLRGLEGQGGSFQFCLTGVGGFPSLDHPQVIWLGTEEISGKLTGLVSRLRGEISQLGFQIDRRPFHPHVTLGRAKKKLNGAGEVIAKLGFKFASEPKSFNCFHLYQSHLCPDGARYEILKTYRF